MHVSSIRFGVIAATLVQADMLRPGSEVISYRAEAVSEHDADISSVAGIQILAGK
jgi:hypothetical protein